MHSTQQTLHRDWLTGVIERITYHARESGYTVAWLKVPRASDLITIVGNFANIQAGQTLQLQGQWREHPQYGSQFQVIDYNRYSDWHGEVFGQWFDKRSRTRYSTQNSKALWLGDIRYYRTANRTVD